MRILTLHASTIKYGIMQGTKNFVSLRIHQKAIKTQWVLEVLTFQITGVVRVSLLPFDAVRLRPDLSKDQQIKFAFVSELCLSHRSLRYGYQIAKYDAYDYKLSVKAAFFLWDEHFLVLWWKRGIEKKHLRTSTCFSEMFVLDLEADDKSAAWG